MSLYQKIKFTIAMLFFLPVIAIYGYMRFAVSELIAMWRDD